MPSGTQIDLPLLPPLDKTSVPAVSTLLLCWMRGGHVEKPRQPMFVYLLALGYVVAPIFTSLGNSYELLNKAGSIPGFYPLDGLKYAGRHLVMLAPFYVGSRFLGTDDGRSLLLKSIPAAALVYSLPMLFEVRMSPQLHRWVYGFFPHSFAQQMRYGGFRPVVFLDHGLQVALFTCLALIAAVILYRRRTPVLQAPPGLVAGYLSVMLLLCKSLGSIVYAVIAAPIALFTRPRTWVKISCVFMVLICAYPVLRTYGIIPVQKIASIANDISPDRSKSFEQRVSNEEQLLAKAAQKPWFGWGAWGRNRLFDKYTGRDISVTDGGWIIEFGTFGWLGYISLFGLLASAAFRALRAVGNQVTSASITIGGLSLLLCVNVIDMLPNSNLTPLTLLLAGSIAVTQRARARRPSPIVKPQPSAATAAE